MLSRPGIADLKFKLTDVRAGVGYLLLRAAQHGSAY